MTTRWCPSSLRRSWADPAHISKRSGCTASRFRIYPSSFCRPTISSFCVWRTYRILVTSHAKTWSPACPRRRRSRPSPSSSSPRIFLTEMEQANNPQLRTYVLPSPLSPYSSSRAMAVTSTTLLSDVKVIYWYPTSTKVGMSTTQIEGCPTKGPTLLNQGLDFIRNLGFLSDLLYFRVVADIKSQNRNPSIISATDISSCVRRSWGAIRVPRFVDYCSGVTCCC